MAESRFFRFVWRVNAIIIFAAGAAAVFALCYSLIEAGRDVEGPPMRADGVVNLATGQVDRTRFDFHGCEWIEGAHVFSARLVSFQECGGGPESEVRATRNYVFYDPQSRTQQWLVDNNDWLFMRDHALCADRIKNEEEESQSILAFLYEFVDTDTNGDRRLTGADVVSLGLSDSKGGSFTVVRRGIEEVLDYTVTSPSSVVVFYLASGELRALEASLRDFRVTRDEAIAGLPAAERGGSR